jgi:hypothetical protein
MTADQSLSLQLPFTDALLRLNPRWGSFDFGEGWKGWEVVAQVGCLALAFLVPLALIIWLYRYELRLVKRGAALTLFSLRTLVIAWLWFILCLQPVLTTETTRKIPTRVIVALDISGSMNATDAQRRRIDKLRLAQALNLELPGGEKAREMLDDWLKLYPTPPAGFVFGGLTQYFLDDLPTPSANDDIPWVGIKESADDTERRQALIGKRQTLYRQISDQVDKLTRLEIALRLLSANGGKLLKDLKTRHRVQILGFDSKLHDLTPERLDKLLAIIQAIKPKDKKKPWEPKPEQTARLLALPQKDLDKLQEKIDALKAKHTANDWFLQPDDLEAMLPSVKETAKKLLVKGEAAPKKPAKQKPPPQQYLTDLNLPLERSLKPAGGGEGHLIGIIFLSDGRNNADSAPARTAQKLSGRRQPIYPVVLGTPEPRGNVMITEVEAPPKATKDDVDVEIKVTFKVTRMKKQKIKVNLQRADQRADQPKIEPQTVIHDGKDREYTRRFVVSMDPDGKVHQTFTVLLQPEVKPRSGTLSQQVVITMEGAKPKVLVIDGEARWEFHYLASALLRDDSVEVERVLFNPPLRDPNISESKLLRMHNPQRKLPEGPDGLVGYQCIILGDVSPEQMPLKDRKRLEEFVSKHGGTLVIIAGKRFTPLIYVDLHDEHAEPLGEKKIGAKDESDPLIKLLPIDQPRVVKPFQGFPVTMTRQGKDTAFMHMEPDAAENEKRWAEFPLHYWAIVGKAKPAATTLAYFRDPQQQQAARDKEKEKDEDEVKLSREQALIARHTYGRGQVLYIGLDSTWRWRWRIGDTYHHRFWSQVIRWAASDYVRLGTSKPVYKAGQDVDISLTLEDKEVKKIPKDGQLRTRVIPLEGTNRKDQPAAEVTLSRPEKGSLVFKGQVQNLPTGQYLIELVPPDRSWDLDLGKKATSTFVVTPPDNKEMDQLETDEDELRMLAEKSGNSRRLYTPGDARDVVEQLTERNITVTDRYERGLWQEWLTLVLFLVLITVEWIGRKWAGLP